MKQLLSFLFLFVSLISLGQTISKYDLVDEKMRKIPADFTNSTEHLANYINANFKTDEQKIRAVFYWTAANISYDLKNMLVPNGGITSQEKINKALKTRKGVCIDYAEIFKSTANQVGIKTYIIEGYTKQNGKINNLSHAWCASKIDDKWYLFDPTWGAGGVLNGSFIKKMNFNWFKVTPSKMNLSHLPFDYLWQFLEEPITNDAFISGKAELNKPKKKFDFESEITRYLSLSQSDQLIEATARIENNGYKAPIVTEYLLITKKNKEGSIQNQGIERMNLITQEFNQGVILLNEFVYYRNRQFKPIVSDDAIEKMILTPKEIFQKCQDQIFSIGPIGKENAPNLARLKTMINDALKNAEEQHYFVQEYLKKSKIGRKLAFSKLSLSGIPAH